MILKKKKNLIFQLEIILQKTINKRKIYITNEQNYFFLYNSNNRNDIKRNYNSSHYNC